MGRKLLRFFGMAAWGGDELLIAFIACGSSAFALYYWVHPALALLPLVPLAIVVQFFRDPERKGSDDPSLLLSPADGTVSDIVELDETAFLGARAVRIGIFLSPFNVHVNRAPCSGRVEYVKFAAGEFLPAYNPEAPTRNESCSMGLVAPNGLRLIVKQITGVLARRIVCESRSGEQLERGARYGMIKFGSRTELYVPVDAVDSVLVKVGDKVRGGVTELCRTKPVPAATPLGAEKMAEAQVLLNQLANAEVRN
ncbi:MAG TPA: phosphatidylserine decarboxylase [Planctomycetota bacterium]|nr:phosphatidylserine decarboxylase [Planctomycetota bacterium]